MLSPSNDPHSSYTRFESTILGVAKGTLLGVARSIEMAELLIKHGAVFKGKGGEFDCFKHYIRRYESHILNHFFNHPEFIYREEYMNIAIDLGYNRDLIIRILDRKRDRQHAVITMSALADRYKTNVYVDLLPLVESFL